MLSFLIFCFTCRQIHKAARTLLFGMVVWTLRPGPSARRSPQFFAVTPHFRQSRFGKPHASYYFKHQSVPKGFVFMKQGERTNEAWHRSCSGKSGTNLENMAGGAHTPPKATETLLIGFWSFGCYVSKTHSRILILQDSSKHFPNQVGATLLRHRAHSAASSQLAPR